MKKKCIIVKSSETYPRHICIDTDNAGEISEILFSSKKYEDKFEYLAGRILEQANIYFDDYKLIYNSKGQRISEMRFFPNGDNCRIYCKETSINDQTLYIVMAKILPKKKSQKIDKAISQLIDSIKKYDYEIEDEE